MKNDNSNDGGLENGYPSVSSVEFSGRTLNLNQMTLEELKAERRKLVPMLREGKATIEDAKRFMSANSLIAFMNTAIQQAKAFNAGRNLDGSAFNCFTDRPILETEAEIDRLKILLLSLKAKQHNKE